MDEQTMPAASAVQPAQNDEVALEESHDPQAAKETDQHVESHEKVAEETTHLSSRADVPPVQADSQHGHTVELIDSAAALPVPNNAPLRSSRDGTADAAETLQPTATEPSSSSHSDSTVSQLSSPVTTSKVAAVAKAAGVSRLRSAASATTAALSGFGGMGLGSLKGLADGVNVGAAVTAVKSLAATPPPSALGAQKTGGHGASQQAALSGKSASSGGNAAPPQPSSGLSTAAAKAGKAAVPDAKAAPQPFAWPTALGLIPSVAPTVAPSPGMLRKAPKPGALASDAHAATLAKLCDLDISSGDTHVAPVAACCAGGDISSLVTASLAVAAWYRVYPTRDSHTAQVNGFKYMLLPDVKGGTYQPSVDDVGCRLLVKARATSSGRALLRACGLRDRVSSAFGMAECPPVEMDAKVPAEAHKRVQLGAARFRMKVAEDGTGKLPAGTAMHVAMDSARLCIVKPDVITVTPSTADLSVILTDNVRAWAEAASTTRVHIRYAAHAPGGAGGLNASKLDDSGAIAPVAGATEAVPPGIDAANAKEDVQPQQTDAEGGGGGDNQHVSVQDGAGLQSAEHLTATDALPVAVSDTCTPSLAPTQSPQSSPAPVSVSVSAPVRVSVSLCLEFNDAFARDVFLLVLRAWTVDKANEDGAGSVSCDPASDLASLAGSAWVVSDAPAEEVASDEEQEEIVEGKAGGGSSGQDGEASDSKGVSGSGNDSTVRQLDLEQFLTSAGQGHDDTGTWPVEAESGTASGDVLNGSGLASQVQGGETRQENAEESLHGSADAAPTLPASPRIGAAPAQNESSDAPSSSALVAVEVGSDIVGNSAALQAALEAKDKELENLKHQLSSSTAQSIVHTRAIADLEARVAAFARERLGMEKSLQEAQADGKKTGQELAGLKQKLTALGDKLAAAEADVKASREAARVAGSQTSQASAAAASAKTEADGLRGQLKDANAALDAAKEDLSSKVKALKAMSSTADEAKVKAVAFANELTSCRAQLKEATTALEAAKEEAASKGKALKAATTAADEAKSKLASVTAELTSLRDSYAGQTRESQDKAAAELQAAKAAHAEDTLLLAAGKDAALRAETAAAEASARASAAEHELARIRTERDDLRVAMQSAIDRAGAVDKVERVAKEAQEALQAKGAELQAVTSRLAQIEQQLAASMDTGKQLLASAKKAEGDAAAAKQQVAALEEQVDSLEQSNEKVAAAEAVAAKAKAEAEAAIAERNAAQRKMESLRRDLARVMSGAEELQLSTVEEMIASKKALEAKVVRLSEEAAGLREALADAYSRTASGASAAQAGPPGTGAADGRRAGPGEGAMSPAGAAGARQPGQRPGFIPPMTPVKPAPGSTGSSGFGFLSPPPSSTPSSATGGAAAAAASMSTGNESAAVRQMQGIIAQLTEQVHDKETALEQQRATKEALAARIRELEAQLAQVQGGRK